MKKTISEKSWYVVGRLPDSLKLSSQQFDNLFQLHPDEREKGMVWGKEYIVPRWQKTFLTPYTFNGMNKPPEKEIPNDLKGVFEYAKQRYNKNFNQMLINWYQDGQDYISLHADDEPEIVEDSEIFSLTLAEKDTKRTFRIRNLQKKKVVDVLLEDSLYLVMGGAFQKEFKHEVTKTAKKVGKRINVTFRHIRS